VRPTLLRVRGSSTLMKCCVVPATSRLALGVQASAYTLPLSPLLSGAPSEETEGGALSVLSCRCSCCGGYSCTLLVACVVGKVWEVGE
jgi:hypothetical protein